MLRFISQMRRAILHLGDASIGIARALPVIVRGFLLALFVPLLVITNEVGLGLDLDPVLFRQSPDVLLPVLTRVLPHNRLHGGVRFQRRRVDAHHLPTQQLVLPHQC